MPRKTCPLLSHQKRADFYTQLAVLHHSGIALLEAWSFLINEASPTLRFCLQTIQGRLQRGNPLSQAGRLAGLFSPTESRLLAVAEYSGTHELIYRKLAEHYKHLARRQRSIRSRLFLPGAVFALALFIQPFPDLILQRISIFSYLAQTIGVLLLIAVCFRTLVWLRTQQQIRSGNFGGFAQMWDRVLHQMPVFGPMHIRRNTYAFLDKLGLLLEAGIPILEALPLAVEAVKSPLIRKNFAQLQPLIEDGMSFSQATAEVNYLNEGQAFHFIRSGEASGSLEQLILRHTRMESEAIDQFDDLVAAWIPRLLYAILAAWMAYNILQMGLPIPEI